MPLLGWCFPDERTLMARHTHRPKCADQSCTDHALFEFTSRRDYDNHVRSTRDRPWRCTRHTRPDEVLSATNDQRIVTLIAEHNTGQTSGAMFWREEGAERLGSGFTYGPGFKAYASDFPVGTRLVITARVEVPATDDQATPSPA